MKTDVQKAVVSVQWRLFIRASQLYSAHLSWCPAVLSAVTSAEAVLGNGQTHLALLWTGLVNGSFPRRNPASCSPSRSPYPPSLLLKLCADCFRLKNYAATCNRRYPFRLQASLHNFFSWSFSVLLSWLLEFLSNQRRGGGPKSSPLNQ